MPTRTIGTDLVLGGEREFNTAMKAINSNLKTMKTDMAAVSAEFDDNAGSMDALTAKQKVLQDTAAQHAEKVRILKERYDHVAKAYGETSAQADKAKQALNQATVAHQKAEKAAEENAEALEKVKRESTAYVSITQRMANAAKDSGDRVKGLGKDALAAARQIPVLGEVLDVVSVSAKGLGVAAKGASSVLKGMGTAAGSVAKGVGIISTAAAAGVAAIGAFGVVGLTTMAGFAKEAAESAKAAQEAGEPLTEVQQKWLAFSGQLESLDKSVASAKSALGGVLLPALSELSTGGAALLDGFARDMEAAAGNTQLQGQIMADYIVQGAMMIKEKLPEYVQVGKDLLSGLGSGLRNSGPELMDAGMDVVMDLLDGIIDHAPELAAASVQLMNSLLSGLTERGPDLLVSAADMVTQIVTGLAEAAPELIPAAGELVAQLIVALASSAPDLLLAGMELVLGIIAGITDALGNILDAADQIIDGICDKFANSDNKFLSIGSNIIRGIWNGISNTTEWLWGLLSGWVDDVVGWICEKLDIHSPSGVTEREVGVQMASGVGVGFIKRMKSVNKEIADSINTSFDVPEFAFGHSPLIRRAYATSGGKTVNLYFYAKSITEADINMVVDVVNRRLGDDL